MLYKVLDASTICCDSTVMKNYIKLLKETKQESKGYFRRCEQLIKAFGADVDFPSDEQIKLYEQRRERDTSPNIKLDAVIEYLCSEYIELERKQYKTKE